MGGATSSEDTHGSPTEDDLYPPRAQPPPATRRGTGGTDTAPDLTDDCIKTSVDAARERFRRIAERAAREGEDVTAEQRRVLEDAEAALKALAAEGESAQLSDQQRVGLEAIICYQTARGLRSSSRTTMSTRASPRLARGKDESPGSVWSSRLSRGRSAASTRRSDSRTTRARAGSSPTD